MYSSFFAHCQNASLLSIGGVAPLNLDTFVNVFSLFLSAHFLILTLEKSTLYSVYILFQDFEDYLQRGDDCT